jgi:hypothetical protein
MGIETTRILKCDHCKQTQDDIIALAELKTLPSGMYFDRQGVESAYGWLALHPEHLCTSGMGHNQIPTQSIVLCSSCRGEFQKWLARGASAGPAKEGA